ncbi:MAG: acetylglutamate kinase [Chitinophagaceae bacterium]|nr:MAG: acetylglutamate kinase [Chitinophagaceae bacterium]
MDKLFIIKIGGNIMDDEEKLPSFLKDFVRIKEKKILVHGGGKIATQIGEKLGIKANYVNGRRITDEKTIDLVTMVYGGLTNKKMVAKLQALNCNAIGVTGADANLIPAKKRPVKDIDYGFVGDIDKEKLASGNVRDHWQLLLNNGLVPVVASLTHDGKGQILNTNADTIASVLAVLLSEDYYVRLVYCFEKKGVLQNVNDEKSVMHLINKTIYKNLLEDHSVAEGILPKLENAFAAIDQGVKEVIIGHADDLVQNLTAEVRGTLIK